MRTVAVIPIKDKSDRVTSKNFRDFANEISLTELKIKQLKESNMFDVIYVSSDSPKARELSHKYGLTFIDRDKSFCNNIVSWSDVIYEVVTSLPEPEDTIIAWCHTTSPLFENYRECVNNYMQLDKEKYNGLVTVTRLSEFIVTERARPLNYHWGCWHVYSQDLEKLYAITGSLFIASKKEMIKNRYVVSTKPYLFEVSAYEAIDVDNNYDFQLAQLLFENKGRFNND